MLLDSCQVCGRECDNADLHSCFIVFTVFLCPGVGCVMLVFRFVRFMSVIFPRVLCLLIRSEMSFLLSTLLFSLPSAIFYVWFLPDYYLRLERKRTLDDRFNWNRQDWRQHRF